MKTVPITYRYRGVLFRSILISITFLSSSPRFTLFSCDSMLIQVWLTVFEKLLVSLFAYNVYCVCIIALCVIKNELNHFDNFNSIFIALERNENTE